MTDEEWLDNLVDRDNFKLYDFIERVGIILDSIKNPTEEQVSAARNQAFKELFK